MLYLKQHLTMEEEIRQQLFELLDKGHAHMTLDEAVKAFPLTRINDKAPNVSYSFWELLEHIRIAQWDILNFIENPNYKEIEWPKEYWPEKGESATPLKWKKTISQFHKDLKKLQNMALNKRVDLYKKIPYGTGQTIFRELLTVADHNSYHLGEFAILRQVVGIWPKNHS